MKYFVAILILCAVVVAEDTTITTRPQGKGIVLFCTNGGTLHLTGEIRVAMAVPTCTEPSCKEIDPDKLAVGAHVPESSPNTGNVYAFCTTALEDQQDKRDEEFCKNNASNPHPETNKEWETWEAEYKQCLKDRSAYRQLKSGK